MQLGKISVRIAEIDYNKEEIRYLQEFSSRILKPNNSIECDFQRKGKSYLALVFFYDTPETSENIIQFVFSVREVCSLHASDGKFTIESGKSENGLHQLFILTQNDFTKEIGYPISDLSSFAIDCRSLTSKFSFRVSCNSVQYEQEFIFNETFPEVYEESNVNIYASDSPIPFKGSNKTSKGKKNASEEKIEVEQTRVTRSRHSLDELSKKSSKKAKVSNSNQSKSKEIIPVDGFSSQTETENNQDLSKLLQKHIVESKKLQNQISSIKDQIKRSSSTVKVGVMNAEQRQRQLREEIVRERERKLTEIHLKYREKLESVDRQKESSIKQLKDDSNYEKEVLQKELEQLERQNLENDSATLQEIIQRQTSSSSSSAVNDPKGKN